MKQKQTFSKQEDFKSTNTRENALIQSFASCATRQDVANLIRDLMTPAEITEFSNRLEIARLLLEGHSYLKISEEVGTSTTTVTRVAHWLFHGCGGYWKVLHTEQQ